MEDNERAKVFLHSIISTRKPEGIYHWRCWSDAGRTEFDALVIHQGRATWYQRIYEGWENPRARFIQEVDRSELLGAPQDRIKCLRIYFSNGATQEVYYCVSVGA